MQNIKVHWHPSQINYIDDLGLEYNQESEDY